MPSFFFPLFPPKSRVERKRRGSSEPTPGPTPQPTSSEMACHTALPGEQCYGDVTWAMNDGMAANPTVYLPLTGDSSRVEFQSRVREIQLDPANGLTVTCQEPCSTSSGDSPPIILF